MLLAPFDLLEGTSESTRAKTAETFLELLGARVAELAELEVRAETVQKTESRLERLIEEQMVRLDPDRGQKRPRLTLKEKSHRGQGC